MKQFKAEHGAVHVNSGQLKLTADQAQSRLHCLKVVDVKKDGSGTYEVIAPTQFKKGEQFGYDGEVGKNGVLRDPEAEELAAMEADEKRVAAATAEIRRKAEEQLQAAIDKARKDLAAQAEQQIGRLQEEHAAALEAAARGAQEALISKLSEDLAGLVRAELAETSPETAG